MAEPQPVYDTRALTDDQRSLADDIASAMGYGHEDACAVWWEDPDGCSCPLLQAVADGLAGARIVEVTQELGYDSSTYRGDRLERRPFRPHPLSESAVHSSTANLVIAFRRWCKRKGIEPPSVDEYRAILDEAGWLAQVAPTSVGSKSDG